MHRSFENWSEDFAFSDELAALEKDLVEKDLSIRAEEGAGPLALDRFVNLLAKGVFEKIAEEAFLERLLKAQELKRDNRLLASQIQQLLKDKKRLEAECSAQSEKLARFKPIVGNIFLKLD